jgi:hypothetical protein
MNNNFDRARFLKVLALTENDQDGEALAHQQPLTQTNTMERPMTDEIDQTDQQPAGFEKTDVLEKPSAKASVPSTSEIADLQFRRLDWIPVPFHHDPAAEGRCAAL